MYNIYVDGQHGTTGLLVNDRLKKHPKVKVIEVPYEKRRNIKVRKEALNDADMVFLCLPDEGAKESVALIDNEKVKVIDASTAHRIDNDFIYGFPELSRKHRDKIAKAKRVSNPGCHATAAIGILYPLVYHKIIDATSIMTMMSITGYSGGGNKMMAQYQNMEDSRILAPRQYGLTLEHKHIPEMMKYSGLSKKPLFMPIVGNFERGIGLSIPIHKEMCKKDSTPYEIMEIVKNHYQNEYFFHVHKYNEENGIFLHTFDIQQNKDTNRFDIFSYGNEEAFQMISCIDNLGKGASGAAIQNMNIMLGLDERLGLEDF